LRVLSTILIFGLARSDPPEVYEVRAARDETHPGAESVVLDLEEHEDEQTSVAEVLDAVPGLQVRTLGGMGSYSAVSIRGSSPSQVAVYLDGVPVNRGALGTVDLSDFAVEGLERIEVWRGLPPPDRMGAGLGGAIDLVPRRTTGGEARLTGGSFGTRGALLRGGDRRGRAFFGATASYLGSEGDFTYRDHNGTLFDPSDDAWVTRKNNGFDQADGVLHASWDGTLQARVTQNVFYKTQGVPGALTTATDEPHLDAGRSLTRLSLGRPGVLEGAAYVTYQDDHYRDPHDEIGNGAQDQRSHTWAGGGELRATWIAGPSAFVFVPQIHHERYAQDEALGAPGAGDLVATRLVAGGAVFDVLSLWRSRLVLEPALRIDRYDDEVAGGPGDVSVLLSPRAGARFTVLPALDVRASGGRYHRAPTFLEKFGDRGFLVGNPDLSPERGVAADAGIVWRGPLRLETTFYVAQVEDLILLVQNSQETLRAQNVGRARLLGSETGGSLRPWSRLAAQMSYAFLWPKNLVEDRQLPGRARHEVYGRLDAGPFGVGPVRVNLFSDVDATAGMYFDAANLRPAPLRAFLGAGVKLRPRRWPELTLTIEAKNLADVRTETVEIQPGDNHATVATQDYLGYPLPGRAFYATGRMTF
jgi:outer membrane cobalamin receptor